MRRPFRALLAASVLLVACSDGSDGPDRADGSSPTVTEASTTAPPESTAPTSTAPQPTTTPAAADTVPLPAGPTVELPAQPDGVPFPGEDWPTGPLPDGVDGAALDRLTEVAFREPGDPAHARSVVVVHGGRLVYEAYHPDYDADTVNTSYSVAKSVASAAIGMLVGDGLVPLDGPAPVAGWTDDRRDISVADLLHMASGLEWLEVYGEGTPPFEMFEAPDASDSAAGRPLVAEPGTVFNYSTGTTAILAQIITDAAWAAERDQAVDPAAEPDPAAGLRFLEERLFDPIGIESVQLQRDPEGTWIGGIGADMTSRDFARFGLLYLRDGVWDGTRILPEGWVQYSFTPSPANDGYGAQWWLQTAAGRYEARGLFGQFITLVPDEDLVVVVNSEAGGPGPDLMNGVLREFRQR